MAKKTDHKAPPIRIRGFKEDWVEKSIGTILSEVKRPITLEDNQQYELITVKRRNGGVVSRGHLFGKDILVKNYTQLQAGDFIISKRQVVHGATGIIPAKLDNAIVSNEYLVAVGNSEISAEFLTIISSLPNMKRKFFLSSYGVDIEKLFFDAEDWKKRGITIPGTVEQSQICAFFKELDRLTELHQHKHEKLVALKHAMQQRMFPQSGATKPEIRFKGFEGEWEKNLLGNITQPISNNALSRVYLNYVSGPAKNIHYGDILVKFGEVIDANNSDIPFISNLELIGNTSSSKLKDGDIIIADAAEDSSVGKCTELVNVGDNIIFSGLHTIALRPSICFAPAYLGYFMNSNCFHDQLIPIMQGTKVLSVSKTALKDTIVYFPKNINEQKKIGNYFRKLDELISQHAIQLRKLKQIKSACLEKMFV
ncbi:TPA: restriction endonuclease subunit S [Citrobacter freundii]|uniref:Type I restriction modification DNA specificity domain-containing protein n=1 Tax=Citrobacter freundii TaxID=546 RepID=A0AAD1TVU5_CITFR|nr:restriction endonuclease subunit S [Citrobacter freundii]NGF60044.1 restriction endonuclease subunit S [Citrobacter freundii]CAF2832248.1 hypothetical protein AI2935V1_4342 [Citrobacter freundii]CAH6615347.1 hypothetical protein AI2935V1_4342 [Citrobacter freundii]HBV8334587.1 restriction endonuclease subunit S [Citrobacter freundii]HCQ7324227.1 restriction endonuclease subunit S [Citrobacter freundii]